MSKHFIKNIEIKNFKCFTDFKAEGFGRVNLIGGKNNVGKTAFMEACYISSSNSINNVLFSISSITRSRNILNLLNDKLNIIEILEQYKSFQVTSINNIDYSFNNNNTNKTLDITINKDKFQIDSTTTIHFQKNKNIVFLDSYGFNNYILKQVYDSVQLQNKDDLLNKYINDFDKTITKFKIINDKPYLEQNNEYYLLARFGDGLKQYISIICALYASNNKYLFLDEIENGIHYTNLDKLWEIILTISKEQNIQIFATTHSKECIESYARVAKRLGDDEIKFIHMLKNKDDTLEAIILDNKTLNTRLEFDMENR